MKRCGVLAVIVLSLLLTGCNAVSVGIIGGADGPTDIVLDNGRDKDEGYSVAEKAFEEKYIDEKDLPVLDIQIENPFKSEDRALTLEDSIDNEIELFVYDYYKSLMSGDYRAAKAVIADSSLLAATENSERNFKDGIYYSQISIRNIGLLKKDSFDMISPKDKREMTDKLTAAGADRLAIVEIDYTVKHNEKSLSTAPQVGDGAVTRYYAVGKKNGGYKILEVYWEEFLKNSSKEELNGTEAQRRKIGDYYTCETLADVFVIGRERIKEISVAYSGEGEAIGCRIDKDKFFDMAEKITVTQNPRIEKNDSKNGIMLVASDSKGNTYSVWVDKNGRATNSQFETSSAVMTRYDISDDDFAELCQNLLPADTDKDLTAAAVSTRILLVGVAVAVVCLIIVFIIKSKRQ